MSEPKFGEIRVITYLGKTSGFQREDEPLGRVIVLGIDGESSVTVCEKVSPEEAGHTARKWSIILGWPVALYKETVVETRKIERVCEVTA